MDIIMTPIIIIPVILGGQYPVTLKAFYGILQYMAIIYGNRAQFGHTGRGIKE